MSDKKHRRAETGPMAFGDDWPGVFIRGDNAGWYAMLLRQHLENPGSLGVNQSVLEGLVSLLGGSMVGPDGDPEDTQYIKDFNEVVVDKTND